jgi:hypothetical protein
MEFVPTERFAEWNDVWSLSVVFGLASIPWTYAFVGPLDVPLWPAFVGSATVLAAGCGRAGLARGAASNLAGICYAAATLAIVEGLLGGALVALSVVVGGFMFLASLHETVPPLSFTPGGFFGYATLFSVHAAGATVLGGPGLSGETLAAAVSMVAGAGIGFAADLASEELS